MAGLFSDLTLAAKALGAQQAGVQVASRNIANVNTPGYSRERVILGDRASVKTATGWEGTGVEALGVKQIRDSFLDVQVTRETATTNYLTAKDNALSQAESALGETIDRSGDSAAIGNATGSTTGISASLSNFFNSVDSLSASPTENGAKQVVVQNANELANKINTADDRLATVQSDLTSSINTDVGAANDLLGSIANLNQQIAKAEVGAPGSALELRDLRQGKLEDLSKYMNFTSSAIAGSNGQLQLTTKDSTGADVVLVSGPTVTNSVAFDGTKFTTGGSGGTTLALTGGSLKGNLDVRDGEIQGVRDDLKTMATQLAKAVNTAYNPTGATGDFFQVPPSTGLIQVTSGLSYSNLKTTDSGNSGANELALAVSAVATKKFSVSGGDPIDGTISSFYNKTVTGLAEDVSTADTALKDQTTMLNMISSQRDSVSGVSMDEEVTDLMKYQRAYQANSRVISVIDSMLESLINAVG